MLPNVSQALDGWTSTHRVKTVARITVDFEPADVVTGRDVEAMVQVADKTKLNAGSIDWSLRYLLVHSPDPVYVGEYIVYNGEDYKIIDDGDYQAYGFVEAVAEQTKRPPLAET